MIHWTNLGREHLLLCLIDPRRRQYTLIANTPKYVQQVKTDDLIALMQKVIDVNKKYLELNVYLGQQPKGVLLASIRGEHIND
jgi:hypothetical protein